jgi:thiamine monophosphate synthase
MACVTRGQRAADRQRRLDVALAADADGVHLGQTTCRWPPRSTRWARRARAC